MVRSMDTMWVLKIRPRSVPQRACISVMGFPKAHTPLHTKKWSRLASGRTSKWAGTMIGGWAASLEESWRCKSGAWLSLDRDDLWMARGRGNRRYKWKKYKNG